MAVYASSMHVTHNHALVNALSGWMSFDLGPIQKILWDQGSFSGSVSRSVAGPASTGDRLSLILCVRFSMSAESQ